MRETFDKFLFAATGWAVIAGVGLIVLHAANRKSGPVDRFYPLFAVVVFTLLHMLSGDVMRVALVTALIIVVAEVPIHLVLIPLGFVRLTHVLATLAKGRCQPRDAALRPLLLAARAYRHRPRPGAARFLERGLSNPAELGPLGATVAAILAEARGDDRGTLQLLRAVDSVAEPEQRGQFGTPLRQIVLRHALAQDDGSELSQFSDPRLTWAYDAKTKRKRRKNSGEELEPAAKVEPSLNALAALARRLPRRARQEDVVAALESLDALQLSPSWKAELESRALALGVTNAQTVHGKLVGEAEGDLAKATVDERWPSQWLGMGQTGRAVRAQVREQRRATVEQLAQELHRRTREKRDLPEIEEWQAWGELVRASQLLEVDAENPSDHELHFRTVHRPMWAYGYRQAFELGRRSLGNAVFTRQRRLAYAAKAADTYNVIEGNLRAARVPAVGPLKSDTAQWLCDKEHTRVWRRRYSAAVQLNLILLTALCVAGFAISGRETGALLVLICLLALRFRLLRENAVVDVLAHEGRVVVQTLRHRISLDVRDVVLKPSSGPLSRVLIARSPYWMPEMIWTAHASPRDAELASSTLRDRVQSTEEA